MSCYIYFWIRFLLQFHSYLYELMFLKVVRISNWGLYEEDTQEFNLGLIEWNL